ncbi:MAG TPA: glycosyltransferase [Acidiphilium sp.]|nr:glycosyltransferase [Acidiphilium sp.]HQU24246.1 glycosyltransferase [Acidiphilium sp.]
MSVRRELMRGDHVPQDGVVAHGQATEASLRVLMATRYGRLGASSRLRLLQYAPALDRLGIECTARPFLSDAYVSALYGNGARLPSALAAYGRAVGLARAIRAHDLIWVEKELLPFLPAALERALLGEKKFILDFDDAWFLRYQTAKSLPARWLLGGKFTALVRRAALTVVANETLHDWAVRQGAREVLLLPTVVDLDQYPVLPEPAGPFTVGWIGTPVTAPYLQAIEAPLRRLAAEQPLELLIIGAPDLRIPGVTCRHLPWSENAEGALLGQCHVGVMPLSDDAWSRGKSGYKLVQYMAAGRATVASPVGANRTIVVEGITGLLASDAEQWFVALRRLRDDPGLRNRMALAARARVAVDYALSGTAPRLAAAMRMVAGR